MKKFLLAISFVFAFAFVANAQVKKADADAPTEKAAPQPGDANYTPPKTTAPATVDVQEVEKTTKDTKAKAKTKKACSKGKSCCKNKAAKGEAKKGEKAACCKKGEKACTKHAKAKKEEATDTPAAPTAPATEPVPAEKTTDN